MFSDERPPGFSSLEAELGARKLKQQLWQRPAGGGTAEAREWIAQSKRALWIVKVLGIGVAWHAEEVGEGLQAAVECFRMQNSGLLWFGGVCRATRVPHMPDILNTHMQWTRHVVLIPCGVVEVRQWMPIGPYIQTAKKLVSARSVSENEKADHRMQFRSQGRYEPYRILYRPSLLQTGVLWTLDAL